VVWAVALASVLVGCSAPPEVADGGPAECQPAAWGDRECELGSWDCYELGIRCGAEMGCYDVGGGDAGPVLRCRQICRLDELTCDCRPSFRFDGVPYGYCANP
jgi:hypothetical protein